MDRGKSVILPFDQFKRYQDVGRIVELATQYFGKNQRILEVGGYLKSGGQEAILPIHSFVTGSEVVTIDTKSGAIDNYIQGNGLQLPCKDACCDITITVDTFEHIPPEHRALFIQELMRVTQGMLIINGPFHSQTNELVEHYLNDFLHDLFVEEHEALAEHIQYGLPDLSELLTQLKQHGFQTITIPSGNIHVWLHMMILRYFLLQYPDAASLLSLVDRYYSTFYALYDHNQPCYRTVVVAALEQNLPLLERITATFAGFRDSNVHEEWKTQFLELCELIGVHHYGFVRSKKPAELQHVINEQHLVITDYERQLEANRQTITHLTNVIEHLQKIKDSHDQEVQAFQNAIQDLDTKNKFLVHEIELQKQQSMSIEAALTAAQKENQEICIKYSELHKAHEELSRFRDNVIESIPYRSWKRLQTALRRI